MGYQKYTNSHTVTANEFFDRLDALEYIRINRTAGLDVIYKAKDFSALDIMEDYYTNRR